MGEFYSKRYFYKGGIGMTQSLKRFASAVLALVMAMTCLVFSNVASVSAADDASDCVAMGSYEWNSTALGGTAKTGTYNNMTYSLRKVDSSYVQLRSENTIKFKVAQDCTLTATFSNNGLFINGTALTSDKAYSLKADTEYTLTGDSGNTNLTKLVFATNSTETTTKATTTTETTTETTTTTTTEATTEATTVSSDYVAMGSYDWNSTALGGTAKTGTYNNMAYSLRTVSSTYVQLRSENTIKFKVAQDCTLTATFSNNGLFINGTALTSDKAYSLKADTEYTLTGDSGNTNLTKLVFATNSTETTTKATTTTETTTETTTTTTTEATTEATTVSSDYVAMGSYDWNSTALGGTAKTGTYNNMAYSLRTVSSTYVQLRSENTIKFKVAQDCTLTATFSNNGLFINGTALTSGKAYSLKADTEYTLTGDSGNTNLTKLVFATNSTETTTETTTKATTTTEATTEATTIGVLKVMVNNPASSKTSTVKVTVKKNGTTVSGVTALNIGSATEIAGVNEDDVITFTFAKEQAKQITNWDSNLKSVFRDKTYTLTYTVGKTVATPTMDYYDSMPAAVSLGQNRNKSCWLWYIRLWSVQGSD